jgi:hypothetical protein
MRAPAHASTSGAAKLVRSRRLRWGAALALLVLAFVAHQARRDFIRAFFVDGPRGPAPALTGSTSAAESTSAIEPVSRLRVVLIDGLDARLADTLPHLQRLCGDGLDLRLDTGFPTVSLPVQHALWTGLTQNQSGVMYRIERLQEPPAASLASRVPHSIAVAESHPEIVHSFGFSTSLPAMDAWKDPSAEATWRTEGFAAAATEAVTSTAALAFIHVLRVDEAGHAHGGGSTVYAQAAAWADDLLDALVRADADPSTRWVVLSDHGHRRAGGHGGSRASIRIVRACVFGNTPTVLASANRVLHLVDLHRFLADSVGLDPDSDSVGRPLALALEDPCPGATLPRPGPLRWVVAGFWVLGGVAATAWAARGRAIGLPWWLAVAYLGVVLIHGLPTLSHPMVYPPMGRDMLLAALPGVFVLTWSDVRAHATAAVATRIVAHTALLVSLALAALTLCGELERLALATSGPPLMPIWTAHASLLLMLTVLGAGGTAAVLLARRGG